MISTQNQTQYMFKYSASLTFFNVCQGTNNVE